MNQVQLLNIDNQQYALLTVDELLRREKEAAIEGGKEALKLFTIKEKAKVIPLSADEWLTTQQAMEFLNIKSAKGFISYRRKYYRNIKKQRTGKGNMYKKSSLIIEK